MENVTSLTLGQIVAKNYKAAPVLTSFGLDFCCRGNQRIIDACKASNIELQAVVKALADISAPDGVNFSDWPVDLLIDYIVKRHHKFIEDNTPLLQQYLNKIAAVHPELIEVRDIFQELSGELIFHLRKEEFSLFPFLRKLNAIHEQPSSVVLNRKEPLAEQIDEMRKEHVAAGDALHRIERLTSSFSVPSDACTTYKVSLNLLREFDEDIHMHVHLENNILFPKALALEHAVYKKST